MDNTQEIKEKMRVVNDKMIDGLLVQLSEQIYAIPGISKEGAQVVQGQLSQIAQSANRPDVSNRVRELYNLLMTKVI